MIRNRTIIRQEVAFAAADPVITDNLPVNPLSFVDIVIRGLTLAANQVPSISNMVTTLARVEVLFRGSAIISLTGADLFALGHRLCWTAAHAQPKTSVVNGRWRVLLRVCFGRWPFRLEEGFPASRAGELQIRYTPAAAFNNITTPSLQVETEELLDASFTSFLKYTTLNRTPAATGESDQDLPIGNPYRGILLFGTTVPTGASDNASMREVRLLIDNQEAYVPRTRWDTLHQEFLAGGLGITGLVDHVHTENVAAAYTQFALTRGAEWDGHTFANYGFIDFDPIKSDDYLLPTVGRSSVKLRINADVADAQRIIPVELISIPGQQRAA